MPPTEPGDAISRAVERFADAAVSGCFSESDKIVLAVVTQETCVIEAITQ
jgi:hypothetical protein